MVRDKHLSFNCKLIAIKFIAELSKFLISIKKPPRQCAGGSMQNTYLELMVNIWIEGQIERRFYREHREKQFRIRGGWRKLVLRKEEKL